MFILLFFYTNLLLNCLYEYTFGSSQKSRTKRFTGKNIFLQTWADAFQGSPELKEVGKVYMELKSKGIEFPMTDLDHMAPIHTPARVRHGS